MTDAQYYTLVPIPLVGILMNGGLFIYLGGRIDRLYQEAAGLSAKVAELAVRMAGLDVRVAALESHAK